MRRYGPLLVVAWCLVLAAPCSVLFYFTMRWSLRRFSRARIKKADIL